MGIYTEKRDQLIEKIKILEKHIERDTAKKKTLEDTAEKVRSSYKEGFKDGVRLMQGVQNYS